MASHNECNTVDSTGGRTREEKVMQTGLRGIRNWVNQGLLQSVSHVEGDRS